MIVSSSEMLRDDSSVVAAAWLFERFAGSDWDVSFSRTVWGQAVPVLRESTDNNASTLRVYSFFMFGALVLLGPSKAAQGSKVESFAVGRKWGSMGMLRCRAFA